MTSFKFPKNALTSESDFGKFETWETFLYFDNFKILGLFVNEFDSMLNKVEVKGWFLKKFITEKPKEGIFILKQYC